MTQTINDTSIGGPQDLGAVSITTTNNNSTTVQLLSNSLTESWTVNAPTGTGPLANTADLNGHTLTVNKLFSTVGSAGTLTTAVAFTGNAGTLATAGGCTIAGNGTFAGGSGTSLQFTGAGNWSQGGSVTTFGPTTVAAGVGINVTCTTGVTCDSLTLTTGNLLVNGQTVAVAVGPTNFNGGTLNLNINTTQSLLDIQAGDLTGATGTVTDTGVTEATCGTIRFSGASGTQNWTSTVTFNTQVTDTGAGTLAIGASDVTCQAFQQSAGGLNFVTGGNHKIIIAGGITGAGLDFTGGSATYTAGKVTFSFPSGSSTIGAAGATLDCGYLSVAGGTPTLANNATADQLDVTSGNLTLAGFTMNVVGTFGTGNVNLTGGTITANPNGTNPSQIKLAGSWASGGTYTDGGAGTTASPQSVVTFNGTGTQTCDTTSTALKRVVYAGSGGGKLQPLNSALSCTTFELNATGATLDLNTHNLPITISGGVTNATPGSASLGLLNTAGSVTPNSSGDSFQFISASALTQWKTAQSVDVGDVTVGPNPADTTTVTLVNQGPQVDNLKVTHGSLVVNTNLTVTVNKNLSVTSATATPYNGSAAGVALAFAGTGSTQVWTDTTASLGQQYGTVSITNAAVDTVQLASGSHVQVTASSTTPGLTVGANHTFQLNGGTLTFTGSFATAGPGNVSALSLATGTLDGSVASSVLTFNCFASNATPQTIVVGTSSSTLTGTTVTINPTITNANPSQTFTTDGSASVAGLTVDDPATISTVTFQMFAASTLTAGATGITTQAHTSLLPASGGVNTGGGITIGGTYTAAGTLTFTANASAVAWSGAGVNFGVVAIGVGAAASANVTEGSSLSTSTLTFANTTTASNLTVGNNTLNASGVVSATGTTATLSIGATGFLKCNAGLTWGTGAITNSAANGSAVAGIQINGGSWTAGNATTVDFGNVVITTASVAAGAGGNILANSVTVSSGTLDFSAGGNGLIIDGGATGAPVLSVAGTGFVPGSGVTFQTGTCTWSGASVATFGSVSVSVGSNTVSLGSNVDVDSLDVAVGTLSTGAHTLTQGTSGGTVVIDGTFTGTGGTLSVLSDTALTGAGTLTGGNIIMNGALADFSTLGSNFTCAGTLTLSGSAPQNLKVNTGQTITNLTINNGTNTNVVTLDNTAATTLNVGGTLNVTSGVFTIQGTNVLSVTGLATITATNGTLATGAGTLTLAVAPRIGGTLNATGGIVNLNNTTTAINTGGGTFTVGSGIVNCAATTADFSSLTGGMTFTADSGTLNLTGTGAAQTFTPQGQLGNLSLNLGATTNVMTAQSALTINGTTTVTAGILELPHTTIFGDTTTPTVTAVSLPSVGGTLRDTTGTSQTFTFNGAVSIVGGLFNFTANSCTLLFTPAAAGQVTMTGGSFTIFNAGSPAGNRITLNSTDNATQWLINNSGGGAISVSGVILKHSNTAVAQTANNSIDGPPTGTNTNWSFGATTVTWIAVSGTNNWSVGGNWDVGSPPAPGDFVVFASSTSGTSVDDITNLSIGSLNTGNFSGTVQVGHQSDHSGRPHRHRCDHDCHGHDAERDGGRHDHSQLDADAHGTHGHTRRHPGRNDQPHCCRRWLERGHRRRQDHHGHGQPLRECRDGRLHRHDPCGLHLGCGRHAPAAGSLGAAGSQADRRANARLAHDQSRDGRHDRRDQRDGNADQRRGSAQRHQGHLQSERRDQRRGCIRPRGHGHPRADRGSQYQREGQLHADRGRGDHGRGRAEPHGHVQRSDDDGDSAAIQPQLDDRQSRRSRRGPQHLGRAVDGRADERDHERREHADVRPDGGLDGHAIRHQQLCSEVLGQYHRHQWHRDLCQYECDRDGARQRGALDVDVGGSRSGARSSGRG